MKSQRRALPGGDVLALRAVLLELVPEGLRQRMVDLGARRHRPHPRLVRHGGDQGVDRLLGGVGVDHHRHVESVDRLLDHAVVAEDHVAVPVVEQGRRGVLVGHEAGEAALAAAVVGLLGGLLDLVPHLHLGLGAQLRVVVAHREVGVLADRAEVRDGELGERVGGEGLAEDRVQGPQRLVEEAVEHPALHRQALGQVLAEEVLAETHHAEVLGVVGHGAPVERLVDAGRAARAAAGGLASPGRCSWRAAWVAGPKAREC